MIYLPGVCVHPLTPRETEKGKTPEYFKIFEKTTIFYVHPGAAVCIAKLYSPADDYKETTTHWKMHFKDEMLMFCCNVEAANWVMTTSSFMVTAVTGC